MYACVRLFLVARQSDESVREYRSSDQGNYASSNRVAVSGLLYSGGNLLVVLPTFFLCIGLVADVEALFFWTFFQLLQAIFLPLQGFFIALVYFRPRYLEYKEEKRKKKASNTNTIEDEENIVPTRNELRREINVLQEEMRSEREENQKEMRAIRRDREEDQEEMRVIRRDREEDREEMRAIRRDREEDQEEMRSMRREMREIGIRRTDNLPPPENDDPDILFLPPLVAIQGDHHGVEEAGVTPSNTERLEGLIARADILLDDVFIQRAIGTAMAVADEENINTQS
eukprot:CAMPEP_0194275716 /NCGR_PEP_ID=MMETSP0169-20130528/8489_1 /TAXON_ID=218684 /ORGANISM="Corethron pennatum, Strain L29A3" /LENGTH=285 /DNA_ID=CAMNT_0039019251 /DNA_START=917 /DNA_END=1774 /DNA_ORIENTATION=+